MPCINSIYPFLTNTIKQQAISEKSNVWFTTMPFCIASCMLLSSHAILGHGALLDLTIGQLQLYLPSNYYGIAVTMARSSAQNSVKT
jgi:hypothetical protein